MTDDERIARLQRLAYGADTPDPVRARAAAELAELTGAGGEPTEAAEARVAGVAASGVAASGGAASGVAAAAVAGPGEDDPAGPIESSSDAPESDPVVRGERTRTLRGPVLLGVAGLVLGAAVGIAIGGGTDGSDPAPDDLAPTTPAYGSGEPGTPTDETLLPPLFQRLPTVADTGPLEPALGGIDPASVRLLATRADGPAAYLARTSEGTDVCLILLVVADGPVESTCTTGGLMPAGGLRIRYASPTEGFVVAILNAAGTITLGRDAGR